MASRSFLRFVTRRMVFACLLVVLVSSGSFWLVYLAPGDATLDLRRPGISQETVARERARLGLDRSFAAQYADWVSHVVRFDFGRSTRYGRPVVELLGERTRNTAVLALASLGVATILGLALGVWAAGRSRPAIKAIVGGGSLVAISVPSLLGSLLLVFLAARTGWFPVGGMSSVEVQELSLWHRMVDLAWHLVLPTAAIALPLAATLERLQFQAMTEALGLPHVRAAVARGVPWRRVVWGHALPVAIRPVVGVYGVIIGSVFSGSFIVEIICAWPGLGQLTYEALIARDTHLVAGCAVVGSTFLALGNLAADSALFACDPRLRNP